VGLEPVNLSSKYDFICRLSDAGVKNAWSYTSTSPLLDHGVVLSKVQGQLYLLMCIIERGENVQ